MTKGDEMRRETGSLGATPEEVIAALLEALKHAVAHLETMAKPTEEYMHHFRAAIAEAKKENN